MIEHLPIMTPPLVSKYIDMQHIVIRNLCFKFTLSGYIDNFESYWIKPKWDCMYHFPIGTERIFVWFQINLKMVLLNKIVKRFLCGYKWVGDKQDTLVANRRHLSGPSCWSFPVLTGAVFTCPNCSLYLSKSSLRSVTNAALGTKSLNCPKGRNV